MASERVALITGSARGMGRAMCKLLAERGHRVVGVDVIAQDPGPYALTLQEDLRDPAAPGRIVAGVISEFGQVDILIHNAAVLITEHGLHEVTLEDYERQLDVNLRALLFLAQAAAEDMRTRGWGRIIAISSIGARTGGLSQSAVYSASKAGQIAVMKNFARNYGEHGVTANTILPGAVDGAMTVDLTPQQRDTFISQIPLGRFAEPAEIARVAAFMASDESSWITGASIDVNGGWLMS